MFEPFPKIPRLNRDIVITEKIDGTNAQIYIEKGDTHGQPLEAMGPRPTAYVDGHFIYAGSRKRIIFPGDDNFGFAAWVKENAEELLGLGEGRHFGEWWGPGIQRGYGLLEKRFSLFNVGRWISAHPDEQSLVTPALENPRAAVAPRVCHVVPVLYNGPWFVHTQWAPSWVISNLRRQGSSAAPWFQGEPEGIIIFHGASGQSFKVTLRDDEKPKGQA